MRSHSSPYLKPGRLADVIAAIQALASHEYYYNSCERWAHIISGDEAKRSGNLGPEILVREDPQDVVH